MNRTVNVLSLGVALGLVLGAAGCATPAVTAPPGGSVSLPLRRAWFEGRRVEYVTTDVSDAGMARMMGVNHVPRLADAAPRPGSPPATASLVERVYMFSAQEQDNVFPSAPQPAGPDNANRAYSPLWRVVLVQWVPGAPVRLLTSEESILDAAERKLVRLDVTAVVANCPVVRSADGRGLTGVR